MTVTPLSRIRKGPDSLGDTPLASATTSRAWCFSAFGDLADPCSGIAALRRLLEAKRHSHRPTHIVGLENEAAEGTSPKTAGGGDGGGGIRWFVNTTVEPWNVLNPIADPFAIRDALVARNTPAPAEPGANGSVAY